MAGSHVRVTILKQRDHALRLVQVCKKRDVSVLEYKVKPYKLGTKFHLLASDRLRCSFD